MKTYFATFLFLLISASVFAQNIPFNQNPKYTSSVNPNYNSRINPEYTSDINPRYNTEINPKYNAKINPTFNSSINPKYLSKLNPTYNSKINPKYNNNLNPLYTFTDKKYLFNEASEAIGVLIYANSDVYLYYDMNNEWIGYFIRANTNYNLFSLNSEWTNKYLCSDLQNGYNLFESNGEWTGNHVK